MIIENKQSKELSEVKKPEEKKEDSGMNVIIEIKEILLTMPSSEYDEKQSPNVLALKSKKKIYLKFR